MELGPFWEERETSTPSPLSCEGIARRWLSTNYEETSPQKQNWLAPWSWTFQSMERCLFGVEVSQSMVPCYSRLSWLRHLAKLSKVTRNHTAVSSSPRIWPSVWCQSLGFFHRVPLPPKVKETLPRFLQTESSPEPTWIQPGHVAVLLHVCYWTFLCLAFFTCKMGIIIILYLTALLREFYGDTWNV